MKNYYRAIALTFRHKIAIAISIFCAIAIGVLWGGNITVVVYPIMEVCLKKDTFPSWLATQLETNKAGQAELTTKQLELEKRLGGAAPHVAAGPGAAAESAPEPLSEKELAALTAELQHTVQRLERLQWFAIVYHRAKPYVDRYSPTDPFQTVLLIVGFALFMSILKGLLTVIHGIVTTHIAESVACELREMAFQKSIRYEINFFTREGVADTVNRIAGNVGGVTSGVTVLYGSLIREPFKMIGCLIPAAMISWQLLLVTAILFPISAMTIRWVGRSIRRTAQSGVVLGAQFFGQLDEILRSMRIVKAFSREKYEHLRLRRANRMLYKRAMRISKYTSLSSPLVEVMGLLMVFVGVVAGSYLVMYDQTHLFHIRMSNYPLSQTQLIAFFVLLAGVADPGRKMASIITQFYQGAVSADRVYTIIDREIPLSEKPDARPLPKLHDSLVFDHVSFEYTENRPVLRDVSLTIRNGETIAIVGPSGCGKSTLTNFIPRFIDPTSGCVRIDGLPIPDVSLVDLRRQISLVTQDPILLTGTVFDNIRYGKLSASTDEVIAAAKRANAHDFITTELKDGYDTQVGPAGAQLSGGQRQRIALARAFIRNPSILLLDEATNQIDVYSEQKIHEALENYIGTRITIIVTHRLAALKLADRIVVMQNGQIAAVGTHQELLTTCSFYAGLFEI